MKRFLLPSAAAALALAAFVPGIAAAADYNAGVEQEYVAPEEPAPEIVEAPPAAQAYEPIYGPPGAIYVQPPQVYVTPPAYVVPPAVVAGPIGQPYPVIGPYYRSRAYYGPGPGYWRGGPRHGYYGPRGY